jgi:NDP-sugar pyrophosphorylase family protein
MKALIFAAGLGTRLRPMTDDRPKAMVEIAGKPMLQHVIERVAAAGFDDITINIHHYGQMIIDFVESHDNFGLNLHISDERGLLLDTGGGILKARQWLDGDEPFLVHNTDIITTLDLKAFYDYHVEHDALATILVKERKTQRYFLFDENDRLCGWTNKATCISSRPVSSLTWSVTAARKGRNSPLCRSTWASASTTLSTAIILTPTTSGSTSANPTP